MNEVKLTDIHIGEAIDKWIRTHNITQAKFAQLLSMPTSNAVRLLKKKTMDARLLQAIGLQLRHNFFREFVAGKTFDGEDTQTMIVNIGTSINRRLKELKMTQTEFAAGLGIYQPEVSKILKQGSIDTGKLAAISELLDYNFFEEYIPKGEGTNETEGKISNDILQRLETLIIENANQRTEIERLQKLLTDAGIPF